MAARKLTPKQEKFAQLYIELGNATAAYKGAYCAGAMKPATINRKATELMQNGMIRARIDALQAKAAKRNEITVDTITAMLLEDRKAAQALEASASATAQSISSAMSLAKLHGLLIDVVKSENRSYVMGIDKLPGEDDFEAKYLGAA